MGHPEAFNLKIERTYYEFPRAPISDDPGPVTPCREEGLTTR